MAVEHAYGRFPDVRYHNNQHAADVLYSTQCLLRHPKVRCNLTKLEIISTLIAATLHDIQHPGLDSGFLVATGHDLSLTYNDKSILENHHASFGFRVMKNPTCDILSQMSTDDRKECRKMVIAMILSTDMSAHFGGVMEFEQLVRHKRTPSSSSSDSATDSTRADKTLDGFSSKEVRTLLTSVLHCADLGACTKSWDYSKRWSFRVLGEFWQQGDKEKQKGLPVGPLNDRDKTNIPRSQINFINIIVKPLWECWNQYIGEESVQVNNLLSNHDRWSAVAEEEEAFPREMCPTVRAVEDKEENLDKNLNHSKLNAKPTISNPELVSNGRVATTFHNDGKTTQKRQTVKKLKTTPRIGRKNKIQSTCV